MLPIAINHLIALTRYRHQSPIPIATANQHHLLTIVQYRNRVIQHRLRSVKYIKQLSLGLLNTHLPILLHTAWKRHLWGNRLGSRYPSTPPFQLIAFAILSQTNQPFLRYPLYLHYCLIGCFLNIQQLSHILNLSFLLVLRPIHLA